MLLLGGAWIASCRKVETVEAAPEEKHPWNGMKDQWEAGSGGLVEIDEEIRMGWGEALTAVKWKGELPTVPFELELEAKRVDGTDFFCGLTFPARDADECVTLIIGGWGGGVIGISSIDGKDASDNETSSVRRLESGVWYKIRLVREDERIWVWLDGEKVIDVDTTGKELSLREGPIEECAPFGLATWQTTGVVRKVRWRKI